MGKLEKDMANYDSVSRQVEISQWSYNNKRDTLFVFQLLFLALTFLTILMYLRRTGMIGMGFIIFVAAIIAFLIALVIANRAQYTNKTRDNRYWNRRRFDGDRTMGTQIKVPPEVAAVMNQYAAKGCPAPSAAGSAVSAPAPAPQMSAVAQLSNLSFNPDTIRPTA